MRRRGWSRSTQLPDRRDRHDLLRKAAAVIPGETPRLDAELLLAHAMDVGRMELLGSVEPVSGASALAFQRLVERRLKNEPVAYITGVREFWSLDLMVGPGVLIPRPDSETLIEAAIAEKPFPETILDLGTGSGALLLAALSEWEGAWGVGVDRSAEALAIARRNALALGLGRRAAFARGDWETALDGRFDLVLCNPPYVETGAALSADVRDYEPGSALFAGADGMDVYRLLIPRLSGLLNADGAAILEFGAGQEQALGALADDAGMPHLFRNDLSGRPRAIILRRDSLAGVGKAIRSL